MAEPDSLMQLGIEAARDGNKEEARNLFRLLTLQDPTNAQAWLWLAGVAETREERQAALERVVELDPTNEMALKGLQALGVQPGSRATAPEPVEDLSLPPLPPPAPAPRVSVDDPFGDEDDPFAELNNLSNVIADSEGPVRRNDPPPPPINVDDEGAPVAAGRTSSTANTSSGSRASSGSRTSSGGRASLYDDDESTTVPARRGLNSLLPILLALVGILLIGLLVVFVFFRGNTRTTTDSPSQVAAVATNQAATATAEQAAILGGTGQGDGATETITPTDVLASPTVEPTVVATVTVPDVSTASPALVSANTPLESAGWIYDFNQPTYAAPIIGPLGQYQPTNGRFVVVLVFAVNNTGTTQTIPTEFFVLKDAQGRVWNARPEVSDAYVIPNVNADLSQTQALSSDGLTRSVALIFDVAPDATNLVFFARSNPAQGWLVLPNV